MKQFNLTVILLLTVIYVFAQKTPAAMSSTAKAQYRTALGIDTMVRNVNSEDLIKTNGVIQFADKPYNVNYSGLGRTKLRKNMIGGVNTLTAAMFPTGNTVYEIHYDYNLAGATITLPSNTYLDFKGGRLSNGSFGSTNDYYVMGDWKNGMKNITTSNYMFPVNSDYELVLDVTDLPGNLAKYNLVGDGVTDNADNFISMLNDSWLIRMAKRKALTIMFPDNNRWSGRGVFLFKKPILVTNSLGYSSIKFLLYSDLKWDFSSYPYSFRTLSQISSGVPKEELYALKFVASASVEIIGKARPSSSYPSRHAIIDANWQSVNGTFYEGVTVNSVNYAATEALTGISIAYAANVKIEGVHVKNTLMGANISGNNIFIDDCTFENVVSENGLTVNYAQNSTLAKNTRFTIVRNCYFINCQDLGLMVGTPNTIVENCISEKCGNNNPLLGANFGVDNSFNSGGGYSVELLAVADSTQREDPNITFVNCIARNCYNYGYYTDSGGIKYIGCKVKGIKPTYLSSMPTNYLYSSKALRGGYAFTMGTTYYTTGEVRYPIKVDNCFVDSVAFTFKNGFTNTVGGAVFTNTKFKNVFGNSDVSTDYATTLQGATFYGCEFDNNYVIEKNHKYYGCVDVNKEPLLVDGYVTKLNSFGVSSIKGVPWSWDGILMSTGAPLTLTDGRPYYFMLDEITKTTIVTSIMFYEVAAASFTADNTNNIVLCKYDGTNFVKIAETANDATLYNTGNAGKTVNFTSPVTLTPGMYAVAFIYNSSAQTTAPSIAVVASSVQNFMYPSNFKVSGYYSPAAASIPSSTSVSGLTNNTALGWFILQ